MEKKKSKTSEQRRRKLGYIIWYISLIVLAFGLLGMAGVFSSH
jgi:hypothetical protein